MNSKYRRNVAAVIVNEDNKILVCKRADTNNWQCPQGGVDDGEKDIDALAKGTGIPGEQLKQFLDVLTKGGRIKEIAGKYTLAK